MEDQCGFNGSRKPPEGTKVGDLVDCSACTAKLIWGFSAIPVLLQIPMHERNVDHLKMPYRGKTIQRDGNTFKVEIDDSDIFGLFTTIEEATKFIDTLIKQ